MTILHQHMESAGGECKLLPWRVLLSLISSHDQLGSARKEAKACVLLDIQQSFHTHMGPYLTPLGYALLSFYFTQPACLQISL